jgi:outer membrane biosynthesis protein TonB
MSKTEGEYELVLGNRQLLSAFFIIVILFGVFFTMGYVVGKNSGPAAASAGAAAVVATSQRPEAAGPATSSAAAPPKEEAKEPALQETKPVETKPVETKPVESQPVAPPEKVPEKADRAHAAPPHRAPAPKAPETSRTAVAVNPSPGNMYLQVEAVAQPQATIIVDTLKQKGFPALLAQSSNPMLFRVMVGPFPNAATLGKAKADLENVGFKPIVRK